MDLNSLSDELLAAEIERRKAVRANQLRENRKAKVKLVLENRDALVKLMTHSRMSCKSVGNSFYNENGCAECNLCCLLDLYEGEDVDVFVEVRLSRPSEAR